MKIIIDYFTAKDFLCDKMYSCDFCPLRNTKCYEDTIYNEERIFNWIKQHTDLLFNQF